jgi:hypothetical protein
MEAALRHSRGNHQSDDSPEALRAVILGLQVEQKDLAKDALLIVAKHLQKTAVIAEIQAQQPELRALFERHALDAGD